MIDVNLDFSGLQDIARDLQTLSKAENNKVLGIRPAPGPSSPAGSD